MSAISRTPLHDLVEVLVVAKHRAAHDLLPHEVKATKARRAASGGNIPPPKVSDVTQEAHDHDPPSEGADGSFRIDFDYSQTAHRLKSSPLPIMKDGQKLTVWRVNNGHTQISVTVETTDVDTRVVRNYLVAGAEPQVIIEVEKQEDKGWVLADVVSFLSGTLNSTVGFANPALGQSKILEPQKNQSVRFTHLGFGATRFRVAAISIGSVRIVPEGLNHTTRFKILPWHPVKALTGTAELVQHDVDMASESRIGGSRSPTKKQKPSPVVRALHGR